MKNFIIVRHGFYDPDTGELMPLGESLMSHLGEKIKRLTKGRKNTRVISSPLLRARQSAQALATQLPATQVEVFEPLGTQDCLDENTLRLLLDFSEEVKKADVVVVAHQPQIPSVVRAGLRRWYRPDARGSLAHASFEASQWGHGIVLNCADETITII